MTADTLTAMYGEVPLSLEKDDPAMARDTASSPESIPLKPLPRLTKTTSNSSTFRPPPRRVQSADTLSLLSTDDFHELRQTTSRTAPVQPQHGTPTPESVQGRPPSRLKKLWVRNKGLALVAVAQMFATLMNITTRLLEVEGNNGKGMHPFQILFARMSVTFILCMLYMWYQQIPDFPLGARGIRFLLVARGVGGFFGVFGLYWSLQYLALADATVLTFLAPTLASYLCSKLINEPFTRIEQLGGLVSFIGVILIARPTYLFGSSSALSTPATDGGAVATPDATAATTGAIHEATPSQRLAAVGMAMLGVLGATCAYTTIRWIGKRAHPLVSVNYFGAWCTIVSGVALAFVPGIPFVLPATLKEWMLLFFIGVSGFVMQFLLTAGLRYEKSSRATNMVYTQLLFALAGDKIVFGGTPGAWSLGGSALILGSALVVAVQKEAAAAKKDGSSASAAAVDTTSDMNSLLLVEPRGAADSRHPDEEMGLVHHRQHDHSSVDDDEDDDDDDDRRERYRGNYTRKQSFTSALPPTTAIPMNAIRHVDHKPSPTE